MRTPVIATAVALLTLLVFSIVGFNQAAAATAGTDKVAMLWIAPVFGAIGGVIYELIALEGNIEWPHKTEDSEAPQAGFAYAKPKFLYDLGIFARIIVGGMAAVTVYWALPPEQGIKLVAVSLIVGSAGTAVFRALQDRVIAALKTAKLEVVKDGLREMDAALGRIVARTVAGGQPPPADVLSEMSKLQGQVQALLKNADG